MDDGERPKRRSWDNVSEPKYVITAEVDRATYDWISKNAAEQGLTIRQWVGLKLTLGKGFEDLERLKKEGETT